MVAEEADETVLWLEILKEMNTLESSLLEDLTKESDELVAIIVSSIKTAKRNYK